MQLSTSKLAVLAMVLPGTVGIVSSASVPSNAAVEYSFREAPLNSLGVKSLADLRGKPVVIDFWGKN